MAAGKCAAPSVRRLDLADLQSLPVATHAKGSLHIMLVGCGGTGSWVAPAIAQLVLELGLRGRRVKTTLVDFDIVEEANCFRQNFCEAEIGRPKAALLAARYGLAWGASIQAVLRPFEASMATRAGADMTVIVGCVDNAPARREIAKVLHQNPKAGVPRYWWIDTGNWEMNGQVFTGAAPTLKHLSRAFPFYPHPLHDTALARPDGARAARSRRRRNADGEACEVVAQRVVQSLNVNRFMAGAVATHLIQLVNNRLTFFKTEASMTTCSVVSSPIHPRGVASFLGVDPDRVFSAEPPESYVRGHGEFEDRE